MAHIRGEDVRGYKFKNEIVCHDCVETNELEGITADEFLLGSEMDEDDYYFCDRCSLQF